jgi:hypothetical protein
MLKVKLKNKNKSDETLVKNGENEQETLRIN